MLHHVSFSVRDTHAAAIVMCELTGGVAVRAPSPPFPTGAWFVTLGDEAGSLIELLPWGTVQTRQGLKQHPDMMPHSASHLLIGSPLTEQEVVAVAEKAGLLAHAADAGLFRFVKVWMDDSFLLELLTREHRAAYLEAFGPNGHDALDDRLRKLEQQLRAA